MGGLLYGFIIKINVYLMMHEAIGQRMLVYVHFALSAMF